MAPQDQRKPRNNARKAAARALQRQHPEMSYLQALAAVTKSAGNAETANPLHLRNLLNIASAEDITARQRAGGLNTTVPVGLSDIGETVSLNIAHANQDPDGTGPHGIITGPGALDLALAMAAALRANNSAERIQVAFAGAEHRGRTAAPAVDHVVTAPWPDWLRDQLRQRYATAEAAHVDTLIGLTEVPLLVVIADAAPTFTDGEQSVLEEAVRVGRSLGVHIVLTSPDINGIRPRPMIVGNLTYSVTLCKDGLSGVAATTTDDHFTFTPTQFGGGHFAAWITAARKV